MEMSQLHYRGPIILICVSIIYFHNQRRNEMIASIPSSRFSVARLKALQLQLGLYGLPKLHTRLTMMESLKYTTTQGDRPVDPGQQAEVIDRGSRLALS